MLSRKDCVDTYSGSIHSLTFAVCRSTLRAYWKPRRLKPRRCLVFARDQRRARMTSRYRKILRAVALVTVFCISNIYVFGGNSTPAPGSEAYTNPQPQSGGTLKTTNNQPIVINGNSVRPGTTVLSGSTLETPDGIGATLQLSSALIEISPNTAVTVEWTPEGFVKATLTRGCITMTTGPTFEGLIVKADGSQVHVGKGQTVDTCPTKPVAAASNPALLAILIGGGAVGALVAILASGGGNPSPSSP